MYKRSKTCLLKFILCWVEEVKYMHIYNNMFMRKICGKEIYALFKKFNNEKEVCQAEN